MASLFKKPTFVGVDIGHTWIKVVQLDRGADGYRFSGVGSAPTPEGAVRDGVVMEAEATGAAIRQALKDGGIGANTAIVSVAGGSVIVRPMRQPQMTEAALRKSIKFEAGRYVPSSLEDSFIECEIMGTTDDGQMDVLVVAAPRELVNSRIRACEAAGLDVEAVDIEGFSSYRALVEANYDAGLADKTVAMVDLGARSTEVSVVSKGQFLMTRSIPQGGKTLSDALVHYFELSAEDAEDGKSQLDLTELLNEEEPQDNPPLRVLQPHIDELIREIRRSLNYYQSQQTEGARAEPVSDMLLHGGGSKLKGIAEYFSNRLDLNAKTADVLTNRRFVALNGTDGFAHLDIAVATGLAMRPLAKTASK